MGQKKTCQYNAKFKGSQSARYYVDKLQASQIFDVSLNKRYEQYKADISGPTNIAPQTNLSEVRSDLLERAKDLNLKDNITASRTAEEIYCADLAERIIMDSQMCLIIGEAEKNARAEVTLQISAEGDERVKASCDYYALWRISLLAQEIEMTLDKMLKEDC